MFTKLLLLFGFAFHLNSQIYSCPVAVGHRRVPHSAACKGHLKSPMGHLETEQQWPLTGWAEAASGARVRRRDSDLIPLDLEVFRRENIGPKPIWKDPHSRHDPQKRKHDQAEGEDD